MGYEHSFYIVEHTEGQAYAMFLLNIILLY